MNRVPLRSALTTVMQDLARSGLNQGAAGNASARIATGMVITPTGVRALELQDDQHVEMSLDGVVSANQCTPSSGRPGLVAIEAMPASIGPSLSAMMGSFACLHV